MSDGLMDRDRSFRLLEGILDRSTADETEAVLTAGSGGLTRFADSRIHQNVAEEDASIFIRVVVGGRVAGAQTNRLGDADLDALVQRAVEIARQTPPDPDFPGFPAPAASAPLVGARAVLATAGATPQRRAEGVRTFVTACAGGSAAGALATSATVVAVANSHGVRAYGKHSRASFVSVLQQGDGSAYVEAVDPDLDRLDLVALGRHAGERARAAQDPVDLEPGTYTVILEPDAVGLMLAYLAMTTFNGRAVLEGRSALATRMGQQIMDPRVQIWDDAADPRTIGLPFDFEGVPKRRLDLVRDGVAVGVAHDSRTARKAGVSTTGHALPQPNPFGPVAANVLMAPGEASLADLVASTDRGVLVTRFHYVRVVHPARTMITGMTRDGTFLIEGGRITKALRNLRFNQSMLDAFSHVEAIGADAPLLGGEFVAHVSAPAMKVREFTFTSRTLF